MDRPNLNKNISSKDFQDFYWLKEELVLFCRSSGISASGGKKELEERIVQYLEQGKVISSEPKKKKSKTTFNWGNEQLNLTTIITDNYKNSENVRSFLIENIGLHFSFNTQFMRWMKENEGKTLSDAIEEWKRIHELKKDKSYLSEIAPQFEYNKYMRAFLADNPDRSSKDAMAFWNMKKKLRGSNEYQKSDLDLK